MRSWHLRSRLPHPRGDALWPLGGCVPRGASAWASTPLLGSSWALISAKRGSLSRTASSFGCAARDARGRLNPGGGESRRFPNPLEIAQNRCIWTQNLGVSLSVTPKLVVVGHGPKQFPRSCLQLPRRALCVSLASCAEGRLEFGSSLPALGARSAIILTA